MTVLPFPSPDDRNPRARHQDPHTSQEAGRRRQNWEAIEMTMLRQYALAAIRHQGLSDDEVMDQCGFDMALDGHRRRCSDLRQEKRNGDGEITRPALTEPVRDAQDHVVTRVSAYSGRSRMVCTLTQAGAELVVDRGLLDR